VGEGGVAKTMQNCTFRPKFFKLSMGGPSDEYGGGE